MCSGARSSSANGAIAIRHVVGVGMVDLEQQGAIGLDDERSGRAVGGGWGHPPAPEVGVVVSVGADSAELGRVAARLADGGGIRRRGRLGSGVGVGSVEGRVTRRVAELSLSLPAASSARTWTTCWPASSLNHGTLAWVSVVVVTS